MTDEKYKKKNSELIMEFKEQQECAKKTTSRILAEEKRLRKTFSREIFTDEVTDFINSLDKYGMKRFANIVKDQAYMFDKKKKPTLCWQVFYHDMNAQRIIPFNIFRHGRFRDDVVKSLNESKNRDEFAEKLRRDLQYYFWCKSEYEVIIGPWCGDRETKPIKTDIYSQVMLNFDLFVDYLWNLKGSLPTDDQKIRELVKDAFTECKRFTESKSEGFER